MSSYRKGMNELDISDIDEDHDQYQNDMNSILEMTGM